MNNNDLVSTLTPLFHDKICNIISHYYIFVIPPSFYSDYNKILTEWYKPKNAKFKPVTNCQELYSIFKWGITVDKPNSNNKIIYYAYTPTFALLSYYFLIWKDTYSHYSMMTWYLGLVGMLNSEELNELLLFKKSEDCHKTIYGPLFSLSASILVKRSYTFDNTLNELDCPILPKNSLIQNHDDLKRKMVSECLNGLIMYATDGKKQKRKRDCLSPDDWVQAIINKIF